MNKHTIEELKQYQSLSLDAKIQMTRNRIRGWVNEFGTSGVYVSFSGGKDSTVLLDIVRKDYPNIEAVFVDTGLEYPQIREFVKTFENVTWLKPKIQFKEVVKKYGYPFISKEVSNNVDGARKYIKILTEQNRTEQNRTEQIPYTSNYRRMCGIGEYNKSRLGQSQRESAKVGNNVGNVFEKGKSSYP